MASVQDPLLDGQRTAPSAFRKKLYGVGIVVGIAVSWVGSTQASESTYDKHFQAPFFSMWFSTCWFILTLPMPYIVAVLGARRGEDGSPGAQRPGFVAALRLAAEELLHTRDGGPAPSLWRLVRTAVPFVVLWSTANYAYSRALMTISATDVTAVFSATPAFVYLLSMVVLGHPFAPLPFLAVLVTIGGVVMVAVAEELGGFGYAGILLTLLASVSAAM